MRIRTFIALFVFAGAPAFAQQTQFEADLARQREHLAESCSAFTAKSAGGCVYTLATDSPFHVALGSIAPQNGFGFGLAFDEHYTPNESWRLSWNADAVGASSGSWRGGVYMKLVHTPATAGVTIRRPGSTAPLTAITPRELPVVDVFAQTISLKTINYFGPGQETVQSGRSVYGERESVVGAGGIYPLDVDAISALHPALVGGVTGRFIDIRAGGSSDAPSIAQLYNETTAPGLSQPHAFVELREGIRLKPSVANGWLRFNYLISAQQYRTGGDALASFNRWTLDLGHEIPLYGTTSSTGPRDFNGPDSCAETIGSSACPPVTWSRNRQGSIGFRLLLVASTTSDGNRVPFYFQPTLGGADINGERLLASYDDYRFRGPNLIALQESFEHAIWGPIGAFVVAEQGKVAANAGDLDFSGLATSASVGLTLRAGGFPMVHLSWSWGSEGHHAIAAMDSSLLGGSARPSLF